MKPTLGEAEFPAVPPLVDREGEMGRIRRALEAAGTTEAPLLLVRGEAGAGKTRLIQEVAAEAARQGRDVVFGTSRAESTAPYHVWAEPLARLGLGYVLDEAPPPRLLGLYVLARDGRQLVTVERSSDGESGPSIDEAVVAPDASEPGRESLLGGGLSAYDRDERRVLVLERPDFRIYAVVEGHEDEGFLADFRVLADTVTAGPSGTDVAEQSFRERLDSGKYEGIDYGKSDPKLRQSRLFQNAAFGLIRKAALRPLVIVFDDLQWADPSSLALLQYVARNLRGSDAHLLGTYRVEEGSVRPRLRDALHRMAQEGLVAEIDLGGLSRPDLGRLAESFIGPHALPEPFFDILWQETRGNPLIVREVLRGLEEEGSIRLHGASNRLGVAVGDLSIPHRVREAVRARLDRVPREDRRLLEAAATCGTRFTTAMVARLVGEPQGKVLNGFGTIAGAHGFLREGEAGFAFDHPAFQEVLYEDMPEDVRRVYHREAADWLELAGGPAEDVAEHMYRARDPRAVEALREAAEGALTRYANEEAILLLDKALELAPHADRGRLLERKGDACETAARFDDALSALREAETVGASRPRCLRKESVILDQQGRYEEALAACIDALASAENEERGLLLLAEARIRMRTGHLEIATQRAQEALEALGPTSNPRDRGSACNFLGVCHMNLGHPETAIGLLEESLTLSETAGDLRSMGFSYGNLGSVYQGLGDYDRGLEYLEKAQVAFERTGAKANVAEGLLNMGVIHLERGELDLGLRTLERCLSAFEALGNLDDVARALTNMGMIYIEQGENDRAVKALRRSIAILSEAGARAICAVPLAVLTEALLHGGQVEEAGECATEALALARQSADKDGEAYALVGLALCNAAHGKADDMRRGFSEALAIMAEIGDPRLAPDAHVSWSQAEKALGNVPLARDLLITAAALFDAQKRPKRAARARNAIAELDGLRPAREAVPPARFGLSPGTV